MRKLHLAKGYFYFTEDSIAEVAFRLGYNESSYFSKVFKKFENMTVKQYKEKNFGSTHSGKKKSENNVDKMMQWNMYNARDAY